MALQEYNCVPTGPYLNIGKRFLVFIPRTRLRNIPRFVLHNLKLVYTSDSKSEFTRYKYRLTAVTVR